MVAGDGDRGGGGGDGGGGEGGGGLLCVRICVGIGVGIHIGIGIHCIVDVTLVRSSHWPAAAGERQQLLTCDLVMIMVMVRYIKRLGSGQG